MFFWKKKKASRPIDQLLENVKATNILSVLSWPHEELIALHEWSRPIRWRYAHLLAESGLNPSNISKLPCPKEEIKIAIELQVLTYLSHKQSPVDSDENGFIHAIAAAYTSLALFQKMPRHPYSPELTAAVTACIVKEYDALLQLPDNPNMWSDHQKECLIRLAGDIAGIEIDVTLSKTIEAEQEALCLEIWERGCKKDCVNGHSGVDRSLTL